MNKKQAKPNEIFSQAEYFFQAVHLIQNGALDRPEIPSAGIETVCWVNHAFAIELYLKCICTLENIQYGAIHNLHDLFKILSPDTKQEISTLYNSKSIEYPDHIVVYMAEKKVT